MPDNKPKFEVRELKDGEWFWIDKNILRIYGKILKASGITVYSVLASFANSKTQVCFPTQKKIAEIMGMSKRTVIRKIRLLEKLDLIKIKRKRGCCFYYLLKPKVTKEIHGGDKKYTSDVTRGNTNKNYLTRINNNNIDINKFSNLDFKSFNSFKPKTREELLALDIARELNDFKSLPVYISYARKYPEYLLRKVLGEVKEIPLKKIKKGRAALFNYLIKKYVQEASKNHRH